MESNGEKPPCRRKRLLRMAPEFSMLLLQTTAVYPILYRIGPANTEMDKWQRINYQLERIAQIAEDDRPKFVFGHFLIPHGPTF